MNPLELAQTYHINSRNRSDQQRYHAAYMAHYSFPVRRLVSTSVDSAVDLGSAVRLPTVSAVQLSLTVGEALSRRRSVRGSTVRPLTQLEVASLLFASVGVTATAADSDGLKTYRRNSPSSGNLGSVHLYPIIVEVAGLEPGAYEYSAIRHALRPIDRFDPSEWLRRHVFLQSALGRPAMVICIAVDFARLGAKYGARGYRLGLIDAGVVTSLLYCVSSALGLRSSAIAGFIDEELEHAMSLDGLDRSVVLTHIVSAP